MRFSKQLYLGVGMLLMLALVLSGCGAKTEKTVAIGSKPMTEQFVLGEMMALLLEDQGFKVKRDFGIAGGTSNLHPALLAGQIDMYPEYSGTGWMFVLKEDLISDPRAMYDALADRYLEEFEVVWLAPFGFNNTYTLAVKAEDAARLDLKTFSDLAEQSELFTLGAEYDFFERDDGFDALVDVYGFNFQGTKEMDLALKYQAMSSGQVNVINAFSTDGLLKKYNLAILEDDRFFFPSYHCAPIVRQDILQKYPELAGTLEKLSGQITDEVMIELNYQVDELKQEPRAVALSFLQEKSLLK